MIKDRIASLDGVRGVAIALVVFQHARLTLPPIPVLRGLLWPIADGHLGVSLFFVLSGYLITRIMRTEHERTGTVSLRSFYFRRSFRILPAYFTFLAIMFLARHFGGLSITNSEFVGAATFSRNYLPPDLKPWWLAHCWSLSVEEQFYLAWPLVISLIGLRRGAWVAVALVASGPFVRVASYLVFPQLRGVKGLDTSVDVLMTGCGLALLEGRPRFESLLDRVLKPWVVLLAPVALILCRLIAENFSFGIRFSFLFGIVIENVAILILIAWIIRRPASRLAEALSSRPLVVLGALSYSLYLWQQPFLTGDDHTAENTNHSWAGAFPANLACALAAAYGSLTLIERPFLRLRARLQGLPRS